MNNWMLRGLVFAALMIVVRLMQGTMINVWQAQSVLISVVLLAVFIIAVVVWAARDGRADAIANPDPDRRRDLAMTWLLTGILVGVLSDAVAWVISLLYNGIYTGGLVSELTTFSAFTALIVFLTGIIGVACGRWRVDRRSPPVPEHSRSGQNRADSNVFAAVCTDDDTPTGELSAAQTKEQTAAVATAESEAPTEIIYHQRA
ncbi:hypothetical protein JK2ML_0520 [Mycobacterium leprae Kyoto-2]|uniref:Membrane protein n=3 Tax=Mycobacterium leprae TaxID=1769 RepID=Q9CCS2_MYCLE|nr:B-4DMT family transporter [Mycobacterium leprae]OAX71668.1 hypothetical protein A3216_04525 [Mycobacterium leprae 7935681]CAR70613.1 putative membrane protein [Mycobacterium leprae Br4923]BBC16608.1 hypothetical protein JK2ML_0520 [Mycobacterium leprae Kyoto-2]AWV47406.1 hypothetical protein DIJ64_02810 [Mycobacterium leprae]OAR20220.1 hypothetical protein A8144_02925 [Mycobacterium leprae 3125609]